MIVTMKCKTFKGSLRFLNHLVPFHCFPSEIKVYNDEKAEFAHKTYNDDVLLDNYTGVIIPF